MTPPKQQSSFFSTDPVKPYIILSYPCLELHYPST